MFPNMQARSECDMRGEYGINDRFSWAGKLEKLVSNRMPAGIETRHGMPVRPRINEEMILVVFL